MKYSKTTTDKSQITLKTSFPHRSLKKSLPKIREKVVPTHFLEINQLYQGKMDELLVPDQWAYIPIKAHKRSGNYRSHTEGNDLSQVAISQQRQHFRSTSETFLKKYLRRKQAKQMKETSNITNYVGVPDDKNQVNKSHYLQTIIKFNGSRLTKYKADAHPNEKEKHSTIEQPKGNNGDDIDQFKSEKMQLKDKLKIYETNIKNKRFQIKIGDRRYKNILHSFESIPN